VWLGVTVRCGGWVGVWGRGDAVLGLLGVGGGSFTALQHSKVCTLCDFAHLQFIVLFWDKQKHCVFKCYWQCIIW
jgi:hypothetical protein